MSKPPDKDPTKAFADAFGDLSAISFDDLDERVDGPARSAPPKSKLPPSGQENSFADARLDAPEPGPLRSDAAAKAPPPASSSSGEIGLNLALVEGGAVVVTAKDLARGKETEEVEKGPVLETRGATGVSAPRFDSAAPAGHKVRSQGLFFYDPVSNVLAAVCVAVLVAIVPAWTLASGAANSDEASTLIGELEGLHRDIELLEDPDRGADGPQSLEAVTVALKGKAREVDDKAGALAGIVSGAHTRFWGIWFGLGIPLGLALSILRRRR